MRSPWCSGQLDLSHLIYLNGRPSEYLKRNRDITFFRAGHDPTPWWCPYARFMVCPVGYGSGASATETMSVVTGRNRIAGLPTQVVRLVPKDANKYGLMLWLEQESGLVLRLDLLDREGNLVEQYMGVDLRILAEPSGWLRQLANSRLPAAVSVTEAYQARNRAWGGHRVGCLQVFSVKSAEQTSVGWYRAVCRLYAA